MRRLLTGLLFVVLAAGCSPSTQQDTVVIDPTTSDEPVQWVGCGTVECGTFTVPVDHEAGESSGVMDLVVYRRVVDASAPVLVLVGSRSRSGAPDERMSARSLAERAALVLGVEANKYTVVSVALRGTPEMPMPDGAERFTGALDVADDLELLRREGLVEDKVHVIGWGDGATAVTAWVMSRPGAVTAAVVDSPVDPGRGLVEQEDLRLAATATAAERAVRWCASHLSCPVNASPTDNVELLRERIAQGNAPDGVSEIVVARAADVALSDGRPNELWRALSEAAARRGDVVAGLAGPTLTVADAASVCRDAGDSAARLLALHERVRPRYFTVGARREMLALCAGGEWGDRPLGGLTSARDASDARVLVTGSNTDPVVPMRVARQMAERLEWTWRGAASSRHLVVGFDRAATNAAMAHLAGD